MPSDPSTSNDLRSAAEIPPGRPAQDDGSAPGALPLDTSSSANLSAESLRAVLRNLEGVRSRIAAAAEAVGAAAPGLVAVTKTVDVATTAALVRAGARDLGENRAVPFAEKADALAGLFTPGAEDSPRWHFIGHLQRNKARRVLERADVLHSVDSLRLAEAVVRITTEVERTVDVFVEVNLTGEAEKHGHAPDEVDATLDVLAAGSHVRVMGLMAMGPLADRGTATVDEVFASARSLAEQLEASRGTDTFHDGRCRLSMGMSGDLEPAIRHGSTHVRVGSALFEGLDPSHRI